MSLTNAVMTDGTPRNGGGAGGGGGWGLLGKQKARGRQAEGCQNRTFHDGPPRSWESDNLQVAVGLAAMKAVSVCP